MNMLRDIGEGIAEGVYSLLVQGQIVLDDHIAQCFTENFPDITGIEEQAEEVMMWFITRMRQYRNDGDVHIVEDEDKHALAFIHLDEDLKHAIASDPISFMANVLQQVLDKKRYPILPR